MNKLVVVSDLDGTLIGKDTLFEFFGMYGKRQRAEELNRLKDSSDVKTVLEEILAEQGPIPLSVFERVADSAWLKPGSLEFVKTLRDIGDLFLVTCTYGPIAQRLSKRLGIHSENVYCTELEIQDGRVTGFKGPVMDGAVKSSVLDRIRARTGLPFDRFVACGDSRMDVPFMGRIMQNGGLGLAFKPEKALLEIGAIPVGNAVQAIEKIKFFARG